MSAGAGWRVPLRIARREAWRAKGRSLLVLVMIALPVAAVAAADVLIHTDDLDTQESLDRELGTTAAALVQVSDCAGQVDQGIDPFSGGWGSNGDACEPVGDPAAVVRSVAGVRPLLEVSRLSVPVVTDRGQIDATGRQLDLSDPLAAGLYELKKGRWPTTPGEVVVNAELASHGPGLGETLTIANKDTGDLTRTVVGIAESTSIRGGAVIAGVPGSLTAGSAETNGSEWLLGGSAFSWDDVLRFNEVGSVVLSRDVALHPTPAARAAEKAHTWSSGVDDSVVTVAVLCVVMVLMEVVLLAGPAFAVGARRQSRDLALIAAAGGTPRQARRIVLATGVVLGVVAGVVGTGLGVGVARLALPIVQRRSYEWLGPFEIPWLQLVGIAAFGFLAALIAAVVPAWIASRQDVVAVLAGRRGDRKPSAKSPFLGLALVGLGVLLAFLGGPKPASKGAVFIALAAILCVLGMLLLVPVVVVAVSRLGRWLPLPMRFAVRDAARHRTRTTPAVAAVAATVAGVVCLSIGMTSDEKQNRETYTPTLPMGMAELTGWSSTTPDADWDVYEKTVRDEVPDARTQRIEGVPYDDGTGGWYQLTYTRPDGTEVALESYGGIGSTGNVVSDGHLSPYVRQILGKRAAAAADTLADGGVVVFANQETDPGDVEVQFVPNDSSGQPQPGASVQARALYVRANGTAPAQAILSPQVAARLKAPVATAVMLVSGAEISKKAESNIEEVLQGLPAGASMYVERGYQADDSVAIMQLVLAALGAVLMLGGTLTATFLALSDARPDLATLSAVGAAPRTRRGVAAAYALAVGGVGAVLGTLVGFVPGIAIAYSATSQSMYGMSCAYGPGGQQTCEGSGSDPSYYLNIPWEMIGGLVVLLPLVVAFLVWVSARSRLPLVARLA